MKKKTFNVMIADDDPDDLDYLKFLLDNHIGFNVTHALTSGRDIIDRLAESEKSPDILITDMYMPAMDGSEVVEHLLANKIAPNMHIFIISTTVNKQVEEKFTNSERKIHFIRKPMNLVEFNDIPELLLENLDAKRINRI